MVAEVLRIRCGTCGVYEIDVPWAGKASKLTLFLEWWILSRIHRSPVSVVSREFRIFDRAVWNIARHHAYQMMRCLDLSDLGMFSISGKDPSVLYEFRVWLIHHKEDSMRICVVCCDMTPSYIRGITETFPKTSVVFDPYHIIQATNRMVEDIRRKSGL